MLDEVVFVLDVADELLDEVLHRDNARSAAVFIDDDGEVLSQAAKLGQGAEHPIRAGEARDLPDKLAHPDRALSELRVEDVANMDEADDIVRRITRHRVARMRAISDHLDRLEDRQVGIEELDLGPRHHDLAQLTVARSEHVVDELALLDAQVFVRGNEIAQLLAADLLLRGRRIDSEQANGRIGRPGERDDEWTEHLRHDVDRRGDEQGNLLDPLEGDPLRDELTEDEREIGDHHCHEDEGDGLGGALAQAPADEHRLKARRDSRCPETGRDEPGEGDADLTRGKEPVGVGCELGQPAAATALLAEPLHLALAQGDERELGRREEPAEEDEEQDDGDIDPYVAHVHTIDARTDVMRPPERSHSSLGSASSVGSSA